MEVEEGADGPKLGGDLAEWIRHWTQDPEIASSVRAVYPHSSPLVSG